MKVTKVEKQGNKVQGGREVWRAFMEDKKGEGSWWVSARTDNKLEMLLEWLTYLTTKE